MTPILLFVTILVNEWLVDLLNKDEYLQSLDLVVFEYGGRQGDVFIVVGCIVYVGYEVRTAWSSLGRLPP
jgi:hypothetical protein